MCLNALISRKPQILSFRIEGCSFRMESPLPIFSLPRCQDLPGSPLPAMGTSSAPTAADLPVRLGVCAYGGKGRENELHRFWHVSTRAVSIWPGRLSRNFTGHFMQVETEAFRNPDPERKRETAENIFLWNIYNKCDTEELISVMYKAHLNHLRKRWKPQKKIGKWHEPIIHKITTNGH